MDKKILIDAGQQEETRVVVSNGSQIDEFYFESNLIKPTRGNIYLAKVVRIEPSLQAAFVEYGGNRHGFLAFNDIHPDYYQIPRADREALLAEQARAEAEAAALEQAELDRNADDEDSADANGDDDELEMIRTAGDAVDILEEDHDQAGSADENSDGVNGNDAGDADESRENQTGRDAGGSSRAASSRAASSSRKRKTSRPSHRHYNLQEVIKNRQILLVQVVKEERGNKGAALTTYLSMAGRYCVLMPNTERGGGISRKIASSAQRKTLRGILDTLELPKGMGLIVRTAGATRTKIEIRRDYDYLLRLWEKVRSLTLKSVAPILIHEEGDLITRSIRDLYDKDVNEVIVEGERGYQDARALMRMLTPSHVKNVHLYKEKTPIFQRYDIENRLLGLLQPSVRLKSGGSLVIEQTEALTAIDVNSGKATREYNIESTALKTNLEATEEAARQMRLRDLSGLIVIDYIDMMEGKNRRVVESRLKECLRSDRARYQVGSISEFGLLELSRQRMRTGILEGSSQTCPHCRGLGKILSVESAAVRLLRAIRAEALASRSGDIIAHAPRPVAFYLLNGKRESLMEIQAAHNVHVRIEDSDDLLMDDLLVERSGGRGARLKSDGGELPAGAEKDVEEAKESSERKGDSSPKRRSRRSRGGKGKAKAADAEEKEVEENAVAAASTDSEVTENAGSNEKGSGSRSRKSRGGRSRGSRGGRRRSSSSDKNGEEGANADAARKEGKAEGGDEIVEQADVKVETETAEQSEISPA